MTEGRSCPLAYRYDPASLCAEPQQVAGDVLYVIGGLYGNPLPWMKSSNWHGRRSDRAAG